MEFLKAPTHGFDRLRHGRRSAGQPDGRDTAKPFRLQFLRPLNVQRSFAGRPTGLDQLTRVVALAAANNHDDLTATINFLSASCRSLVGLQTVSANRIFAFGCARAISITSARTRSIGCVVCETIP